jgi:hypothetical protein
VAALKVPIDDASVKHAKLAVKTAAAVAQEDASGLVDALLAKAPPASFSKQSHARPTRRITRYRRGVAHSVASLGVIRRRGRQKFRRFSEDLVTPQAFADPRLACALAPTSNDQHQMTLTGEGSPVFRETA